MEPLKKCVLCCFWSISPQNADINDVYEYECPACGKVNIDHVTEVDIRREEKKYKAILSGYSREAFYRGRKYEIRVSPKMDLEEYVKQILYPKNLSEKMDKVMDYLEVKSDYYGALVQSDPSKDAPISYSIEVAEHLFIISQLKLKGWIEEIERKLRVTADGWQYLDERRRSNEKSKSVFVATWFADELDEAYKQIERAVADTGYSAVWMKISKHNDMIDNRIIAELRKCKFAICDFTGHRNNVYFEAGFAKGLNIPVIWMCRDDDKEKLAFDTRQFLHILWKSECDIYQSLRDHIEATIQL